MDQIGKQFGKAVLYTIATVLILILVITEYKTGGAVHELVTKYMDGICGG